MAAHRVFEVQNSDERLAQKAQKQKAYEASPAEVNHSVPINTILPHRNALLSLLLPNLFKSPHPFPIVWHQSHTAGHLEANPGCLRMRLTSYTVIQPFNLPFSRLSGRSLTHEFHLNVIMRAQPIVTEQYRPCGLVHVYGCDKALVAIRTFHHKVMDARYMVDLMQCVDKLAASCGIKEPGYNTNEVTLLKFELDGTMGWVRDKM